MNLASESVVPESSELKGIQPAFILHLLERVELAACLQILHRLVVVVV